MSRSRRGRGDRWCRRWAGLGGFLLLVPLSFPRSAVGWLSFAGLIVSAGLVAMASVLIFRLLRNFGGGAGGGGFLPGECDGVAGGRVCWMEAAGGGWMGRGWISAGVAAGEAVLLAVLLREIPPVRLGARFLVVPLLAIVEGALVLRPEVTLRMLGGAGLMAGAATVLLAARGVDEVSSLSLR